MEPRPILEIERLVIFAILMENGEGILSKAPDYIMEKWGQTQMKLSFEYIFALLDGENQAKFRAWQKEWRGVL